MKTARSQSATLSLVTPSSQSVASGPASLLHAVLGNLQDGFIMANQAGDIEQINLPAERICTLLNAEDNQLPPEIWQVCKSALRNKDVLSFNQVGIDADIILPDLGTIRIRVQNITMGPQPFLLIVLEDRQQTTRNKALSDAALYGLTERELEIWQMRLRGDAYKDISATLWISIDTVKKHVKNILAKQRSHQDDTAYALMA